VYRGICSDEPANLKRKRGSKVNKVSRFCISLLLVLFLLGGINPFAQAQQATQQKLPSDTAVYEKFRSWVGRQPREIQQAPDLLDRYRAKLLADGEQPAVVEEQLRIIREQGRRLEIERWNRILTSPTPVFNTKPNAYLVQMTQGVPPGKALDVGMGQGRNALYLAQQGWEVTGFDPAEKAVAAANAEAGRLGLKLTTLIVGDEEFDFGKGQWDIVVLSYVSLRHLGQRVFDSLKPGGRVIVEGFHRDATKNGPIGGGVVFDTNELLMIFNKFRILHYEDVQGVGDFGLGDTRLVRLCARKP
jgi:SAM-dependent methyltransferase